MRRARYTCFLIWFLAVGLYAQNEQIYSLLTLPATQRSLSLYRGQLQINGAYIHGMSSQKYSSSGSKLSFEESASNFLNDDLSFMLSYGILDYIELSGSMNYINQTESLATKVFWNGEFINEVYTNRQIKGAGHLDLFLKLKQPFFKSGFDADIWGGISLPVFSQYPPRPLHSLTYVSPSDPQGPYMLNYHYIFKPEANVTLWSLGLDAKLLIQKFALYLSGSYKSPAANEETYHWSHTYQGNQFSYLSSIYKHLPASHIGLNLTPAYQVFPWFTVYLSLVHAGESGGWTEETGSRIAIPNRYLGTLSPGFEILISAGLRFIQYVDIPIYGMNTYSLFSIRTSLSFNLFPVKRYYH